MKGNSYIKSNNTLAFLVSLVLIGGVYVISSHIPAKSGLSPLSTEPNTVQAAPAADQLCGFAWAGTSELPSGRSGAGWISMNSRDCDFEPVNANGTVGDGVITAAEAAQRPGCPATTTAVYNVHVEAGGGGSAPRQINGYAWSSNLGWLKFGNGDIILSNGTLYDADGTGELSGFPNVSGYGQQQARISNAGNQPGDVYGWARFCAGTVGGACATMTSDLTGTGGWDGWVALAPDNGTPFNLQYIPSQNRFNGWSWGGAFNPSINATTSPVGWINWNPTGGNRSVQYCFVPIIDVDLSLSKDENDLNPYEASFTSTLTGSITPIIAGADNHYSFACDYNRPFSSFSTSPTYNCTYPHPAGSGPVLTNTEYTPTVVGRRTVNGQYAYSTTSRQVLVRPEPLADALGAVCEATPDPVRLNNSSTWNVTLETPGALGDEYTYTFNFSDAQANNPNPAPITSQNTTVSVNRSFRSLGQKTLTVNVRDNTAAGQPTGQAPCTVRVVINPVIIEE